MGVRYALAIAAVFLAVSVVGSHAASYESEPTLGVNVKDEIKTLFNEWMQKFEKTYETIEETEFRLKTWATNHLRILKHNLSGDKSFTMAMNQFGDMTPEEFNKRKGLKVNMGLLSASKVEPREYDISSAPKELDWRTKGAVTAVKDQGDCGSCWSFSATGALEGANFLSSGKLVSLSEQELVSCSDKEGNMGCNGGLMDNAFKWIEKDNKGLASEDDYPYVSGSGDVPSCEKEKHKNVMDVQKFTDVEENNPKALLAAVAKQPVSIAIEADMSAFQFYSSGVIKNGSCGTSLDHGVLLVGYGTENGTDYWLVKNSWATSWGDEGYVKIERDMKTKGPGTCGIQMKASYPTATKDVPTAPSN